MKKLFSLLAMAAMVFTACQNDEGVKNPTLADEGIVNLSVGVPELATRAMDGDNQSGADSAYGAIDYANYGAFLETDYDVRFQLAVYEAGAAEDAEPVYATTNYVDFASTTNFNDLRFVPGREYQFVIFADFVPQGTEGDFRYNTADLRNITTVGNSKLNAMDETYDAYFFNETIKIKAGEVNYLEATLKRPFGKIRVLTTDYEWVKEYAAPVEGTVTFYNHAIYKSFNALTGEVSTEATNDEESLTYAINKEYYGATKYEGKDAATLFATYILGNEWQEAVNFRLDTFDEDGSLIKSLDFNTEIPYQRNHLTTLVGNLLTNEADLFVRIDDNFDAEEFIGGDFENLESGLGYVREGEAYGSYAYKYETNLFYFTVVSDEGGKALPTGEFEYTDDETLKQNEGYFSIEGIDVEKGTLTIEKRNTRAEGDSYYVVFDIYATINGKTENYILTWTGVLKAPRTVLDTPVVEYDIDEEGTYITFSWDAVEGAKNYTVSYNGEKQTVEGTSATFVFTYEAKEGQLVVKQTAYVTANPELTWSNTESTATVNIEYNIPITWTEVPVFLQYVKDKEVAFYTDGLTIYFEKYPSLEGAWYQTAGEIPTPFSKETTVEETTGSAAQVVIADPVIATKFIYTGAMNPYILNEYEINWVAGYNTVDIKFFNKAGDAIEFETPAPMEAGKDTIKPTYVAIGGDEAANIKNAEMNVLLEDGEYTIFFNIHSAINDVLMQYVGKIDFEKPYAPDYELTSYEARENTIYFKGEAAEFEIEATSLESGDVVVKKIILNGSDDYAASNQVTAATAVVKEKENGDYDARYTVTVNLPIVGEQTSDLQYVGPFKAYEAPAGPEQVNEFQATYENVEGLAVFTGIEYDYKIFVNNLATVEYDGTQADGWGARSLKFPAGEGFYSFNHGDKLTVDGDNVTLEFVGWNGSKMRMLASTAPATQEPEDITVELAKDGDMYVGGNYTFIQDDMGDWIAYVNNHKQPSGAPVMINLNEENVIDAIDDLTFEFFDEYNYANVTAIYDRFGVTTNDPLEIMLALDEETGYLVGSYEDTVYTIMDDGKDFAGTITKGNEVRYGIIITVTDAEDGSGKYYTFYDELNERDVKAFYQTSFAPVDETVYVTFTKIAEGGAAGTGTSKFNLSDEAGNKVSLVVDNAAIAAGKIVDGNYTWISSYQYINNKSQFSFVNKTLTVNGATFANADIAGTMTVVDGKITLNMSIFEVPYVLVYTPSNTPVVPEQPTTYEEVTLTATYETFIGSVKAYHAEPYWINGDTWMEVEGIPSLTSIKQEEKLESTETNGNVTTFKFTDEVNKKKVTVTYTDETQEPEQTVVENIKATYKSGSYGKISVNFADANNAANNFDCTFTYSGYTPNGTYTIGENATVENGTGTIVVTVNDPNYSFNIDATVNGVVYKGTVTMAL